MRGKPLNCFGLTKKVVYEKINAKKLKADLKVIASIESFLLDSKPTNFIIDSNYDIDYLTIISDSTKSLEKKINSIRLISFDYMTKIDWSRPFPLLVNLSSLKSLERSNTMRTHKRNANKILNSKESRNDR